MCQANSNIVLPSLRRTSSVSLNLQGEQQSELVGALLLICPYPHVDCVLPSRSSIMPSVDHHDITLVVKLLCVRWHLQCVPAPSS